MAAIWPHVIAYLPTTLPGLSGWSTVQLFDGPVVGSAPSTDYITIGYTAENADSGLYQQRMSENGFSVDETGTVLMELTCQTGDDAPTALAECRARAFGLVDVLDSHLRGDQTLGGVMSVNSTVDLSAQVLPFQNSKGAAQVLVLTLTYFSISWQ